MFKSVFLKYITGFMLIILFCMFFLATIVVSLISNYNTNVKKDTVKNAAEFMADITAEKMKLFDAEDLRDTSNVSKMNLLPLVDSIGISVDDFILFIADTEGEIFLAGGDPKAENYIGGYNLLAPNNEGPKVSGEFISTLKENGFVSETSTLGGIFDEDNIIYAIPVNNERGNLAGIIIATTPVSGMNDLMGGLLKSILMSAMWIILSVLVVVYFISERLLSPIRSMSKAAKKFAKGDFDIKIPVKGNDEIAELCEAFNNMALSLKTNEETRKLFLQNVAHDLRTPMTTISGFIDSILAGAIPPEQQEHYLEVISSEVKRLSRLVSCLLDITRIEAGERKFNMSPFDICEMCRRVLISSEQRITDKKLDVEFNCDDDNMFVLGDVDAINQIVYNIMDNAIKFSKECGKYIITIKNSGDKVITDIYNEGVGISPDDLPFVFDRFYKSDKSRGLDKTGVGLGMYIAHTIIDAHDEKLTCDSEYGKWCRFTFSLKKANAKKYTVTQQGELS